MSFQSGQAGAGPQRSLKPNDSHPVHPKLLGQRSSAMRSRAALVLSLMFLAGLHCDRAFAQFLVVYPGSTIEGDLMRGWGIAAFGAGSYNANTTVAQSIQADTWMRLNQYAYESLLEEDRRRAVRLAVRHQRVLEARKAIEARLVDYPDPADIYRGDALNALTRAIDSMGIQRSAQRSTRVGVPGGLLREISLMHGPTKTVISVGRLDVRDRWPRILRDPVFAPARQQYETILDRVMADAFSRQPVLTSLDALGKAVDNLQMAFQASTRTADSEDRRQGRLFLDQLRVAVRALRDVKSQQLLADVLSYLGSSVADLLSFMDRNDLRFARAETPRERELYEDLYALLSQHRDRLKTSMPPR
jgi:hypothetical protein